MPQVNSSSAADLSPIQLTNLSPDSFFGSFQDPQNPPQTTRSAPVPTAITFTRPTTRWSSAGKLLYWELISTPFPLETTCRFRPQT
jgi:hypothetical protein